MVGKSRIRLHVIGYVRVSTKEQADEGVSLEIQEDKLRAYCGLHDLELLEVVVDAGKSAKDLNRPGIQTVLEALRSGRAQGVVVAKLDRLTRSLVDLHSLIRDYFGNDRPHKLFSVADHIDTTTAVGRMILNLLMTIAQWQREDIQERVQDGHDKVRARGSRPGCVPFGRRLVNPDDPADKRLEDDPDEVSPLLDIVTMHLEGQSYRAIAAAMTARGIATKTGRDQWSPASIQSILKRYKRNALAIQAPERKQA